MTSSAKQTYIRWFNDIRIADIPLVGGKNASLGEMVAELSSKGIRVPNGFAVTADAYWNFLDHNHLKDRISELLVGCDATDTGQDVEELSRRGRKIRELILSATMPPTIEAAISQAYTELGAKRREPRLHRFVFYDSDRTSARFLDSPYRKMQAFDLIS